jgi:hypothetical protein
VADVSGQNNHGSIYGAKRVAGKHGRALSFDGINDLVTIADSKSLDLTTAATVEAWVRPTALGSTWRTVLVKERPAQLSYALYAGNGSGKPSGHVFTISDRSTAGASALTLKRWAHLATTWDGRTLRLYVNGVQVAERALTGRLAASSNPLRIGGNNVWREWFKGEIDDVRVYNRALTATQVGADRNAPVAGPSAAALRAASTSVRKDRTKLSRKHRAAVRRARSARHHRH